MRRLAALHLVSNAALLWLGYYWLGVGETRTSTLLWSFSVALFTACAFCALHGAGLVWGTQPWPPHTPQPAFSQFFRTSLRNLAPLLIAAVLTILLYVLLTTWSTYSRNPAFKIASYLTMTLRKPVKPAAVLRVFNVALWLIRWVALPVLLLPVLSAVATSGWRGFVAVKTLHRNRRYWLQVPLLLLTALWLPFPLMAWKPFMSSFGIESLSLAIRGLVAYLLFVAGLLVLELVAGEWRKKEAPIVAPESHTV